MKFDQCLSELGLIVRKRRFEIFNHMLVSCFVVINKS